MYYEIGKIFMVIQPISMLHAYVYEMVNDYGVYSCGENLPFWARNIFNIDF